MAVENWRHLGVVRVHIDHIENPDRDVWAVSQGRRYATVHAIDLRSMHLSTVFRGPKGRQPRAYLEGVGTVTILEVTRRGRPWRVALIMRT